MRRPHPPTLGASVHRRPVLKVNVKWGKQQFENVEIDTDSPVELFKAQLFALTQVPPERQKIMGVKGGAMKDDADLAALGLKDGQKIMLMGSAEVLKAPEAPTVFAEDMAVDEVAALTNENPGGLTNLGNTCYLNSGLQVMKAIPEIPTALQSFVGASGNADTVTVSMRELIGELLRSNAVREVRPLKFVSTFRTAFPMFAERTENGQGFVQQDAEECWSTLVTAVRARRVATGSEKRPDPPVPIESKAGGQQRPIRCDAGGLLQPPCYPSHPPAFLPRCPLAPHSRPTHAPSALARPAPPGSQLSQKMHVASDSSPSDLPSGSEPALLPRMQALRKNLGDMLFGVEMESTYSCIEDTGAPRRRPSILLDPATTFGAPGSSVAQSPVAEPKALWRLFDPAVTLSILPSLLDCPLAHPLPLGCPPAGLCHALSPRARTLAPQPPQPAPSRRTRRARAFARSRAISRRRRRTSTPPSSSTSRRCVWRALRAARCVLRVACCALRAARCVLRVACCVLHATPPPSRRCLAIRHVLHAPRAACCVARGVSSGVRRRRVRGPVVWWWRAT